MALWQARPGIRLHVTIVSCNVRFMERRLEIRNKALEYCLVHGVGELSLRPLADAIGTSARLLIYHFGSKEGLIGEVIEEARARVQRSFTEAMRGQGRILLLNKFWSWATHPDNGPYVRLLFEIHMLALQHPDSYAGFIDSSSSSWLTLIESALPPTQDRRAKATLCAAVMDGLVLEYLNTGDLERTSAALDLFGSLLANHAGSVAAHSSSQQPQSKGLNP